MADAIRKGSSLKRHDLAVAAGLPPAPASSVGVASPTDKLVSPVTKMLEGGGGKRRFMLGREGMIPGAGAVGTGSGATASMMARRAIFASAQKKQVPRKPEPGVVQAHHEDLPGSGSSAPSVATEAAKAIAKMSIAEAAGSPTPPMVAEEGGKKEKTAKALRFDDGLDNIPPPSSAISPKAAAAAPGRPILGKREPLSPSRPSNGNMEGFSRFR